MATLVQTIEFELTRKINDDVFRRAGQLTIELLQDLRELYRKKMMVKSGASGALGSIVGETKRIGDQLDILIGFDRSIAGLYLAALEFGESGTESTPAGGAAFKRTRMPPVRPIYRWVRESSVAIPTQFAKADDPALAFAWAIAVKRKKHGRAGWHLAEKFLRGEKDRILQALAEA